MWTGRKAPCAGAGPRPHLALPERGWPLRHAVWHVTTIMLGGREYLATSYILGNSLVAIGEARADPMAEPFGAKGSGDQRMLRRWVEAGKGPRQSVAGQVDSERDVVAQSEFMPIELRRLCRLKQKPRRSGGGAVSGTRRVVRRRALDRLFRRGPQSIPPKAAAPI